MSKTLWEKMDEKDNIPSSELTQDDYVQMLLFAASKYTEGDARLINKFAGLVKSACSANLDITL